MQQRVLFIADYLRQIGDFSALCTDFGISRKTGYKWVERYRANGVEGLSDLSSRPVNSPDKTPYRIEQ